MKRFTKNPKSKLWAQRRPLASRPDKNASKATNTELRAVLQSETGIALNRTWMDDREYFLPRKKAVESLLWWDGTNSYTYTKEGGDCDNFAGILLGRVLEQCMLCGCTRGIAFGKVTGKFVLDGKATGPHKMNIVITDDKRVWLVEPQSNKMFRPHADNEYWIIVM